MDWENWIFYIAMLVFVWYLSVKSDEIPGKIIRQARTILVEFKKWSDEDTQLKDRLSRIENAEIKFGLKPDENDPRYLNLRISRLDTEIDLRVAKDDFLQRYEPPSQELEDLYAEYRLLSGKAEN